MHAKIDVWSNGTCLHEYLIAVETLAAPKALDNVNIHHAGHPVQVLK